MKEVIAKDWTRLRKLLEEAEVSQVDVCRVTGLESSTVSRIVTGRFRPTSVEKLKIASALGKRICEVFPSEKT